MITVADGNKLRLFNGDKKLIMLTSTSKDYVQVEKKKPQHLADNRDRIAYSGWREREADFHELLKNNKDFLPKFLERFDLKTAEQWLQKNKLVGDVFISKYILTFDEYDAYAQDACVELPNDEGWGRGQHPAIHISIVDSVYYVNWINQVTGRLPKYVMGYVDSTYGNSERDVFVWRYPGNEKRAHDYIVEEEARLGRILTVDEKYAVAMAKSAQRIPTSDEWLMCINRPNETWEFPGSDKLERVAWFRDNSGGHTHPVGKLKPNSYGIYDMYGNVWEMCLPEIPPVMTPEIWQKHYPNEKYLDTSNPHYFLIVQDR